MTKLFVCAAAPLWVGLGILGASEHQAAAWIGAAGLVGAACLWLGRVVWRTSEARTHVCDKIDRLAEKHDRTHEEVHALGRQVKGVAVNVTALGSQVGGCKTEIAALKATCVERGKAYDEMLRQGRKGEGGN